MATILLSAAAQVATQSLSNALLGGGNSRHREGARLESLSVQTSTYGDFIPLVYGSARIAGNVIWSRPMKEVASTTTTTQGKGGGGASASSTEYSYYATLAIAICEGAVDRVERVWADAKQLDLSQGTYRFYTGSDTQLPDALIESFEGVGATPAYRGLCYVVIEDFPLADYGNRIPNFTFEVRRSVLWEDVGSAPVEHLIEEMVLIPGSGEYVYDTQLQEKVPGEYVGGSFAQSGSREPMNQHTGQGKANALVALEQLEEACPNTQWVALVVNWFGTSMDLTACEIVPGVEFADSATTTAPDVWSVGNYTRASAHAITYVDGSPRYGGTPDDQSLQRLCDELIARGKKILCLPMFLMDVDNKPWRGRLTGAAGDVANFFGKAAGGYNQFILHYANLLKDKIDAFAIGSELVGLTSIHDGASMNRQFPAVGELVSLAAACKGIVGAGVQVTYAADWSEYHHAEGGWYHMDALWGSPNIDVIGIDAYFPLTDAPQSEVGYDVSSIQQGWVSGEGYDWHYTDAQRTIKANLQPQYAWKNIQWFWENTHINPDGNSTAWVAQSKKIWFTEYGFPSVDGATNQPNVFYDPTSSESFFPRHSQGRIDFRAQRAGIAATLAQWKDSSMVERTFLWTWDARPYPYWPDLLNVWADGSVWITGHWAQGKLGLSSLSAIVFDLCRRAGLETQFMDVAALTEQVDGFVVKRQDSARDLIETLMSAYFFDAVETDGQLRFVPRGNAVVASIAWQQLAVQDDVAKALSIERLQELELPQQVEVNHLNRLSQYQTSTQVSRRQITGSSDVQSVNLPIVMDEQRAKVIADVSLYEGWMGRTRYAFEVPMKYGELEPADVIEVIDHNHVTHQVRILSIRFGRPGRLQVEAVAEDVANYDFYSPPASTQLTAETARLLAQTQLRLLDLPALPTDASGDAYLRVAMAGLSAGWSGAALYRSDDGGASFGQLLSANQPAVMGTAVQALGSGPRNRFDEASSVIVVLLGDNATLASASEQAVLNGANLAMIGDELIQFKAAQLIAPNKYQLSGLLRGRLGTESAIGTHDAGEPFVLIDGALQKQVLADGLFGLARSYKAASFGQTLGSVTAQDFTYQARALKPYAPVHANALRDGAGNLHLSWVRRTRSGGHWRDGGDVLLGETSEAYEIEVLDGSDVVRVIALSEPQAVYSAAEQITDFGALQSSIAVRIYQLSEKVGRGEGVEVSL